MSSGKRSLGEFAETVIAFLTKGEHVVTQIYEVELRNGGFETNVNVATLMFLLRKLADDHPIVLYELWERCRDPYHQLFGNSGEILRQFGLLESDDQPHDTCRNIVLSAIECVRDDFGNIRDFNLVSPLK